MLVDSLVVELGLDPRKFNEGQRRALDEFKKTKDGFVTGGKDIEYGAQKSIEAIAGIRTQTLQMFSAFAGGAALLNFAKDAIHAGAAAGRMSRNLGVSVETITKFQGLAEIFGGSAEGMAKSFIQITDALEGWKVGDVSPIIAEYRALGAAGGTMIDINKGAAQTVNDIAANLKALHDQNPATGGYWQRRIGIDPGLYDAMIQKGKSFNDLLRETKGLTDDEAAAASKLEQRWNSLYRNATRGAQGIVLDLVDSSSKFNPLKNGSDEKDIKMIAGWIDSMFGTHLSDSKPAAAPSSPAGSGAFTSQADKEAFIRSEATKRGLDPDVMVKVARSEGFDKFLGDNGTSGGAFQLHVTPGGRGNAVGDQFQKATNLSPLDPANERAAIQFALDDIRAHGLSAYHGAARVGLGPSAGGAGGGATNSVVINGGITVNTKATDAAGIAQDIGSALKSQSFAAQANYGQN